eukprot:CAMPEP_0203957016 /NCGR_PEP_ID=MMETSP0359-20131031/89054_1 /ASSEMBLY_ACC=CAM_ASM_000338 /TAXON_ID=268821 /ORGANISM="Scrippsiella Hangoei, Strain SHTV-5" /LENGTH=324 /DNA_ID=CAMNT_0050890821 /DNA_START=38 /DNA_END=1008 /DNA_ORIENTATION=+
MSLEEDAAELDLEEDEVHDDEDEEENDEEFGVEETAAEGGANTSQELAGAVGKYNAREVNDQVFEELVLVGGQAEEVQTVWKLYLSSAESREAAGEAIYAALFDAAPSIQSLFKTPRAVMAMRFMNGLSQIIGSLDDPKAMKIIVETLGFQHLDLEVTVPRVIIFRDAIIDLLAVEMGSRLTPKARDGFATFLNYVGGSYIYVRVKFSERLKLLNSSWATATKKGMDEVAMAEAAEAGEEGEAGASGDVARNSLSAGFAANDQVQDKSKKPKSWKNGWFSGKQSSTPAEKAEHAKEKAASEGVNDFRNTSVPTTYNEMFMFNAA